jgi:flavin-dependent dehydrogenase
VDSTRPCSIACSAAGARRRSRARTGLPNFYRDCAGAGWALVGDAAYHRDPLTGMGIGDAFLGAEVLAEAIDRGLGSDLDAALKATRRHCARRRPPCSSTR